MLNTTYQLQHLTLMAAEEIQMRCFYRDILGLVETNTGEKIYHMVTALSFTMIVRSHNGSGIITLFAWTQKMSTLGPYLLQNKRVGLVSH